MKSQTLKNFNFDAGFISQYIWLYFTEFFFSKANAFDFHGNNCLLYS